jgi:hypothetical protein
MHVCPRCGSERLVRSHTRWYELPWRWLSHRLPVRCGACRWRTWEPATDVRLPSRPAEEARPQDARAGSEPPASTAGRHHRRNHQRRLAMSGGLGIVLVAAITAFAGFWIQSHAKELFEQQVAGAGTSANPSLKPVLSLQAARAYQDDSKAVWLLDGVIKNLGSEPLANVEAVSTWLDRDGLIVATDSVLVDLRRLMPGEVGRFRTVTRSRPGISQFDVQFRTADGVGLKMTDDSNTPKVVVEPEPPPPPPSDSRPPASDDSPSAPALPASLSVH